MVAGKGSSTASSVARTTSIAIAIAIATSASPSTMGALATTPLELLAKGVELLGVLYLLGNHANLSTKEKVSGGDKRLQPVPQLLILIDSD